MYASAVATRYQLAVDRYERARTQLIDGSLEWEQVATFDFVNFSRETTNDYCARNTGHVAGK